MEGGLVTDAALDREALRELLDRSEGDEAEVVDGQMGGMDGHMDEQMDGMDGMDGMGHTGWTDGTDGDGTHVNGQNRWDGRRMIE